MQEVEGPRIRISSDELKKHCLARAVFHAERSASDFEKAKELRKIGVVHRDPGKGMTSNYRGNGDPAQDALERARDLDQRASRFQVLAKYMIPDAWYTLSDSEADHLELLGQFRKQLVFE